MKSEFALPPELAALFESLQPITTSQIAVLERAAISLESDPSFQADFCKGQFIIDILKAMKEERMTQTSVAKKLGKSRQFLNKLLNEDRRVNFTLETMVALTMAVGRKFRIQVTRSSELLIITPSIPRPALSSFPNEDPAVRESVITQIYTHPNFLHGRTPLSSEPSCRERFTSVPA